MYSESDDQIKQMIDSYKKHISLTQLKDEVYKWELIEKYKGRPNLDADDLYFEIKSINYSNLIYHLSKAVINELTNAKPEVIKNLFVELFDESVDLTKRIKDFSKQTKTLYKGFGKTNSHHQDERTISSYLTIRNPEKYTFYKHTYYKNYCNLLGIKQAKKNEQYAHYLTLIDELIENYILPDKELIEQVKSCIPQYYNGTNHRLLAQDILYQILDKNTGVNYWVFQGNPKHFNFEAAFKQEVIESWTVTAHKEKIKEGDKVIIWLTGKDAGCYALAEVKSKPYERVANLDDEFWLEENKNSTVADIEITHNLVDNPLMKDEIIYEKELTNLNVGIQGSNFTATEKEYNAILKIIDQSNSFEEIRKKFDLTYGSSLFENFIVNLRKIVSELNLEPNDDRVVYSVRYNRLNFIIGQRYCFNIHLSHPIGVYGFISTEKLSDDSEDFKGLPEAYYNNTEDFNPISKYWKLMIHAMSNEIKRTNKSSFLKSNNKEFENYVFDIPEPNTPKSNNLNYPLNTIFYGPPGTGKTYNTVLRAAEIIEGRKIEDYGEALEVFNANLHNQIEFITFHQNYSYEDFIQGIRPDTDENEVLTFEKRDGVFKKIADRALKNLKESEKPTIPKKSFEEAFNQFVFPLAEGEVEEIEVKMTKVSYYITAVTDKSIDFRKASGGTAHTLSISTLNRMYEAESVLNIKGLISYYAPLLNELLRIGKDSSGRTEVVKKKNYVIIIDEINRANISRVFGELITLIEVDKRSHGEIPLETHLPSGDKFIVPSNLYIIGTMNTADKSIALLDIALRRRFEFEAMYPSYEIDNIHDVDILERLNKKIIETKGYDFQIGHSFFLSSNGDDFDLVKRMNNKVIPLLLEYYMNDDKEVRAILQSAGLVIEENLWPLRIIGKNDKSV